MTCLHCLFASRRSDWCQVRADGSAGPEGPDAAPVPVTFRRICSLGVHAAAGGEVQACLTGSVSTATEQPRSCRHPEWIERQTHTHTHTCPAPRAAVTAWSMASCQRSAMLDTDFLLETRSRNQRPRRSSRVKRDGQTHADRRSEPSLRVRVSDRTAGERAHLRLT